MKILFIYGAGGDGREVYDLVQRNLNILSQYTNVYFLDDNIEDQEFYGTKLINIKSLEQYFVGNECEFVPAIGEPCIRQAVYEKGLSLGFKAARLIDQTAIVSETAVINPGCVIKQYVEVSSNVEIGEGSLLQPSSFLGHDIKAQKCCVISTGAAIGGATHIGERAYIGLNVSIRQGLSIGRDTIIAMGSVVYKDVGDGLTVIGNPARVTKGNDQHKALV